MTDEPARRYRVPARRARVEDRIEKSRFIASVARAPSAEDARSFVDAVRTEFPDATHHCFAFVAGAPGSTMDVGASDDGEPAGTAGRPMLSVLLNSGVGEIVVVVTRYFGGVKLGKGGLVRAYTGAVQHALREMETVERVSMLEFRLVLSYAQADGVRHVLARAGAAIVDEDFAARVTFTARIPDDRRAQLERALADATAGSVRVEWGDTG